MSAASPPRSVLLALAEPRLGFRLRDLLDRRPDTLFLAAATNGERAARLLRQGRPDLVLLDVRLPGNEGLRVVETVGAEAMPAVVFVTGLDSSVLRAFEIHALDYLLEPFDDAAFHAALDRARRLGERFAVEGLRRRLARLLAADEEGSRRRRVPVRNAGGRQFVPLDEVRWVEGAGSYSRLHLYDGGTHLLRQRLDDLAERFADDFFRIHRSALVRSSEVAEVEGRDEEVRLVLRDGRELVFGPADRHRPRPLSPAPRAGGGDGRRVDSGAGPAAGHGPGR